MVLLLYNVSIAQNVHKQIYHEQLYSVQVYKDFCFKGMVNSRPILLIILADGQRRDDGKPSLNTIMPN